MKLLLDSDMLLYRVAAAQEVEVEIEPWLWVRSADVGAVLDAYWQQIDSWLEMTGAGEEEVLHCFTDASAFRHRLFPQYKHSRKSKPKPIGFKVMRNEVINHANAYIYKEIEADDVISILAGKLHEAGEPYIICSGDKDLRQIHGHHLWLTNELAYVSQEEAERFTWQQYLQGDPTDGIPGCPGLGEVGAAKLAATFQLDRPLDCWEEVVRAYEKGRTVRGKSNFDESAEDRALQQARLVRLLRNNEYDFTTNTVTPWNPPTH